MGEVIAVVSATGGCGKTFLATNIAYHLHVQRQKQTCLIDLDLQFGELSTALRLKPNLTIIDLLSHDDDETTCPPAWRSTWWCTTPASRSWPPPTGRWRPTGSTRPTSAGSSTRPGASSTTSSSTRRPPVEAVLVALEYADRVFAVATLDLPSVRNLGLLLAR